jgi:iron-sulfur cluster repair protein YtfE (RIC family)
LKRNKGKALNITLSDEFDSENFNSSSNNEFVFVALSDTIKISYDSDTDQTISNYSDLNITFVITYHELSLQEAYKDLCEVVKVKKLFNKLTDMENNLAEALKLSKVEISRSLMKVKALENELTMCKQSQEPSAT